MGYPGRRCEGDTRGGERNQDGSFSYASGAEGTIPEVRNPPGKCTIQTDLNA